LKQKLSKSEAALQGIRLAKMLLAKALDGTDFNDPDRVKMLESFNELDRVERGLVENSGNTLKE